MTPEAQRIAIAESQGLETHRLVCDIENECYEDCLEYYNTMLTRLPDYLKDRCAMLAALNKLNDSEWMLFLLRLKDVKVVSVAGALAEAYLKTINKWDDSK